MKPLIYIYGTPEYIENQEGANYRDALVAAGAEVLHTSDPADAAGCDGLLLPGGGDVDPVHYGREVCGSNPPNPLRDAAELRLAREFIEKGRPVFGICRGSQVLNIVLGGTLIQDMPGHKQMEGGANLWMRHLATAVEGSLMERLLGREVVVNSSHHQAVETPGKGLRVTMYAEDGTVEALEHESLPVIATQWHPERLTGQWTRPDAVETSPLFAYFVRLCREKSGRETL